MIKIRDPRVSAVIVKIILVPDETCTFTCQRLNASHGAMRTDDNDDDMYIL